jgi:hypothetical protein
VTIAGDLLERLFSLAQKAQARGDSPLVSLPLTKAQCPAYFTMRNLSDAEEFRAELGQAQRKGAIVLTLGARQRSPRDIARVAVADLTILAGHLGLALRARQIDKAKARLNSEVLAFPVLNQIIEAWQAGKAVRKRQPTDAAIDELADAVRLMTIRRDAANEALMRRESIRVFGASKYIEQQLGRWLDILYTDSLASSGLTKTEVFSAIGLSREPQPFLIAADAIALGEDVESRLFRPYHGLPMDGIQAFRFDTMPSCVLTVENKQTFHELAALARRSTVCVVYSGGMPSPAWHHTYGHLLKALGTDEIEIYHFGDVDLGGYRIAHAIWHTAAAQGRSLQPWLMDPHDLHAMGHRLTETTPARMRDMHRWCERMGWTAVADHVLSRPGTLEQEAVMPTLPAAPLAPRITL